MRKIKSKPTARSDIKLVDATIPAAEGYDDWAKAKIAAALKQSKDSPEARISQDTVWRKFGLED